MNYISMITKPHTEQISEISLPPPHCALLYTEMNARI